LDDPNIGWLPPPELIEFLNQEPKPVYIGFGSIVVDDPGSFFENESFAISSSDGRF